MKILSLRLDARAPPVTDVDKSTAICIATWLLAVVYLVMYLSRQSIKFVVLRKVQIDDFFILAGTAFALGLSIATSLGASRGLGKQSQFVSPGDLIIIQKTHYAGELLYISSLCFAKVSLVAFFHGLGVNRSQRRAIRGLGVFIIVWTGFSLIPAIFQCGIPKPWEVSSSHCFDKSAFWTVYGTIDIGTDLAIVLMSILIIYDLHVAFSRKVAVFGCFAPRILVVTAAVCRLVFLIPLSLHDDPTFKLWIPTICTQVQVCLSITTACIPYMKPFFEGVESGVWRNDDLRRRGLTIDDLYGSGYIKSPAPTKLGDSYLLSSGAKISIGSPTPVHSPTPREKSGFASPVRSLSHGAKSPSFTGTTLRGATPVITVTPQPQREQDDSISYESEGSEVRIIQERKGLTVFPKH